MFLCCRTNSSSINCAGLCAGCFSAAETDNTTKVHPCGIENKSKNKDRGMTERDGASLLAWGLELCMLFCLWPEVVQSVWLFNVSIKNQCFASCRALQSGIPSARQSLPPLEGPEIQTQTRCRHPDLLPVTHTSVNSPCEWAEQRAVKSEESLRSPRFHEKQSSSANGKKSTSPQPPVASAWSRGSM